MNLPCPVLVALAGIPVAVAPPFVRAGDPPPTGTVAARDLPAAGTIPDTGGQDLSLPAAGLLLTASILAYAVLRRQRRP